jgi:hypothetical protein
MRLSSILIAAVIFVTPMQLAAEEALAPGAYTPVPIRLIVVGTQYRADIDVVMGNLAKSPQIRDLTPTIISKMHQEYSGVYTGNPEFLLSDIKSLAQDRFSVESSTAKDGSILITLKKAAQTASPQ